MPDNIQSAMFEILKRVQTDVSDIKARVERIETRVERIETRVERLETRAERLELIAKRQRRDSAAMLVMMRGTVGVFDERMKELEADVKLLQELEA